MIKTTPDLKNFAWTVHVDNDIAEYIATSSSDDEFVWGSSAFELRSNALDIRAVYNAIQVDNLIKNNLKRSFNLTFKSSAQTNAQFN